MANFELHRLISLLRRHTDPYGKLLFVSATADEEHEFIRWYRMIFKERATGTYWSVYYCAKNGLLANEWDIRFLVIDGDERLVQCEKVVPVTAERIVYVKDESWVNG